MTTLDARQWLKVRDDIVGLGYSADLITSWQIKTTYYVHRPILNIEGVVQKDTGFALTGLNGDAFHANRYGVRNQWFQWEPGQACLGRSNGGCSWCRDHYSYEPPPLSAEDRIAQLEAVIADLRGAQPAGVVEEPHPPPPAPALTRLVDGKCEACGRKARGSDEKKRLTSHNRHVGAVHRRKA